MRGAKIVLLAMSANLSIFLRKFSVLFAHEDLQSVSEVREILPWKGKSIRGSQPMYHIVELGKIQRLLQDRIDT